MPKPKKVESHRKKKLPWIPSEILRVPLNPEQAVLSCCDSGTKTHQESGSFPYSCTFDPCYNQHGTSGYCVT